MSRDATALRRTTIGPDHQPRARTSRAMRIRSAAAVLLALALVAGLPSVAAARKPGGPSTSSPTAPSCSMPRSDAEGLEILSTYYPGYWWDHTHLTVAVEAQKGVQAAQLAGVHDAIDVWADVLLDCFDGLITVTDVTGSQSSEHQAADIVLHYVLKAGGVSFAGFAVCGDHGCPNIMVSSDLPPGKGGGSYDPEYLGWVAQHELGHALGLGHATNLLESTDLMGYGWPDLGDPVLSRCDVKGIAFVFAWALAGESPHPPAAGPMEC